MQTALSIETLMIAATAVAAERQRLVTLIAKTPPDEEAEQHLSEQVLDIDRALGELADVYEALRGGAARYPEFDALVASVEARG